MGRRLLARLLALVIRGWTRTLRYDVIGGRPSGPGLVAFLHGDQLPLLGLLPGGPLIAPVSLSRDGRLQAAILGHLGIGSVAGSTSRSGARAAKGLLRALCAGATALIAVDGPRGPFGVVKPGVVYLAAKTGLPIWPVAVAARRGRRLTRAWDRFLLPRPFTRTLVLVGEPVFVREAGDPEDARAGLEASLRALREAAVSAAGDRTP